MDNQQTPPASTSPGKDQSIHSLLPSPITLFKDAFHNYKEHFKLYIPFIMLIATGSTGYALLEMLIEAKIVTSFLFSGLIILFAVMTAIGYISMILTLVNKDIFLDDVYKKAAGKIFPLFLINLLTGLALLGGYLLLIIPGIIFSIWFYFGNYAYLNDNTGIRGALERSKDYVQGHWWYVFGCLFVLRFVPALFLYALLLGSAVTVQGVLGDESQLIYLTTTVITFAAAFILTPIEIIATYKLYMKLKEAYVPPAEAPKPAEKTA